MTPDEIQRAIEGLLAVQRDLQDGQLANRDAIAQQSDQIAQQSDQIAQQSEQIAQQSEQIAQQTAQIESLRVSTEGLVRVSENFLVAQERQQESINQLKRTVDYLLSKDGES